MNKIFSEYEVRAMAIKHEGEEAFTDTSCVGSSEEAMNARVITKKCRGIVKKKVVRGDGTGNLKLSLHMPYDLYVKSYGMDLNTLKDGVMAYGENSVHRKMSVVQDVLDEDGNEKLKAYPNCVIETGVARKTENGAEEVAELELEVSVNPDEYGNGMYEALTETLTDETIKTKWMTAFTPDLVQKTPSA